MRDFTAGPAQPVGSETEGEASSSSNLPGDFDARFAARSVFQELL
jgi:hypothetical protein